LPHGSQNKAPDQLFTVSVCQAEMLSGIAILPKGQRRDGLQVAATAMFREDFAGRVLPFDTEAAVYGELFAARRCAGRPGATADLMIASVARARGASVVTRDAGGFEDCGLSLIDPWMAA
jgi:predicted nucleic acid-binding protein